MKIDKLILKNIPKVKKRGWIFSLIWKVFKMSKVKDISKIWENYQKLKSNSFKILKQKKYLKEKGVITKFFYPDNLNGKKEREIFDKAFQIRLVKNYISEIIFKEINRYKDFSKNDLIKDLASKIQNPFLTQKDIEYAIIEVWTTYRNKIELINGNIIFKIQNKIIRKYYKRDSGDNRKGDLRIYEIKFKSTKFTKVMSFLSRYGYFGIQRDIEENLSKYDSKKVIFYNDILYFLRKFGEKRLLKLAFQKRLKSFQKFNRNQHIFNSLSFTTQSRIKTDIVNKNINKNSKIDGFISIGGYKKDDKVGNNGISKKYQIDIPTKIDQNYHLNFKNYSKVYTVQFEDNRFKRVNLTIETEKKVPIASISEDEILGVDINIKNNLFATSDKNITIDYDRNMLNDYVKFLKKIDKRAKTEDGRTKKLGKKQNKIYQKWQIRVQNMVIEKVVELVKSAKNRGYSHLVLEDLELLGKLKSDNKEFSINSGRLIRLLNLSSIKNRIINIANRYGVNISFIHPEYTSQTCNKCGCISQKNRKTQESFRCIECEFSENADFNSAINIKNRILLDVLRDKLLQTNNFSEFRNKNLKKETIKSTLENYYRVA
jgi:IS605 OrfB family transposase